MKKMLLKKSSEKQNRAILQVFTLEISLGVKLHTGFSATRFLYICFCKDMVSRLEDYPTCFKRDIANNIFCSVMLVAVAVSVLARRA
jgi:hypothetical protein